TCRAPTARNFGRCSSSIAAAFSPATATASRATPSSGRPRNPAMT
ncbi:uncharacterized protein METZ01_LOCUS410234, partial [marine metagenome]